MNLLDLLPPVGTGPGLGVWMGGWGLAPLPLSPKPKQALASVIVDCNNHVMRTIRIPFIHRSKCPFRMHESYTFYVCTSDLLCMHKRISCVYTRKRSCACTALSCMLSARRCRGQGAKKAVGLASGPGQPFLLGPWSLASLAQSMHKSAVHAQEISCVYAR